jgi:microcystin-dependent protein
MANIAPFGRYRGFDGDGAPLAGGKLYTYEAGTSTPKATYTTKAAGTANANPVVLDGDGYADVWLDTGGYKFVLKDANDVTLWTTDNIDGGSATGFASQVVTKSSSFSLTTNEQNFVVVCTSSLTISLLSVATAGDGFVAVVINTSAENVTIDPDGSETINGASTLVLGAGESATLHTNGVAWYNTTGNVPDESITPDKLSFGITGIVAPYTGSTAPTGWLLCYGQAVSRTTYAALFAVMSTTFGVGDGSTTFNLPDLRGRTPFGVDNMGGSAASRVTSGVSGITGTTLGAVGGSQIMHEHSHTATVTDPGHNHQLLNNAGGGTTAVFQAGGASGGAVGPVSTNVTGISVSIANAGTGASQNMPPAMMLNYIVKT